MSEERTMTLGLAIREALHQEMERDASVIIMGEDIVGGAGSDEPGAEDSWGGPMGITRGLAGKFGRDRVRDTPISEAGFIGAAVGAAATGLRPIAALMFIDFFGIPDGSDLQPGSETALHVRRQGEGPDGRPCADWGRGKRGGAALPESLFHLYPYPRLEGGNPHHTLRCQGTDDLRHSGR